MKRFIGRRVAIDPRLAPLVIGVIAGGCSSNFAQDLAAGRTHSAQNGGQVGDVAAIFTNAAGDPLPGLEVSLHGLDRTATTDDGGQVYFSDVPVGRISLALTKTFDIVEDDGSITPGRVSIDDTGDFFVPPFMVTTIQGKVDAPVQVARPACLAVPGCMVVGLTVPSMGLWRVDAKGNVTGPCLCSNATSPNIGGVACPGSGLIAGPLPAPGAVWSIVTDTCLPQDANPNCHPQVSTAPSCSIVF